eukprot:scaffold16305_cov124-Isochrysis_galbana.AAC.12
MSRTWKSLTGNDFPTGGHTSMGDNWSGIANACRSAGCAWNELAFANDAAAAASAVCVASCCALIVGLAVSEMAAAFGGPPSLRCGKGCSGRNCGLSLGRGGGPENFVHGGAGHMTTLMGLDATGASSGAGRATCGGIKARSTTGTFFLWRCRVGLPGYGKAAEGLYWAHGLAVREHGVGGPSCSTFSEASGAAASHDNAFPALATSAANEAGAAKGGRGAGDAPGPNASSRCNNTLAAASARRL